MITIKFARMDDIKDIMNLERTWIREGISPNAILSTKKEVGDAIKEKRVIVAADDDKIIGFLLYKFWSKDSCELDSIYVLKRYREHGIGNKLVKRFLSLKPIKKCKQIWIHADSVEEEKLLKFYSRFGFKKVAITMLRKQHPRK